MIFETSLLYSPLMDIETLQSVALHITKHQGKVHVGMRTISTMFSILDRAYSEAVYSGAVAGLGLCSFSYHPTYILCLYGNVSIDFNVCRT